MQKIAVIVLFFASSTFAISNEEILRNQNEIKSLQKLVLEDKWSEAYKVGISLMQNRRDPAYTNIVADIISLIPQQETPDTFVSKYFKNFIINIISQKSTTSRSLIWKVESLAHKEIAISDFYIYSPSYDVKIFKQSKDCIWKGLSWVCEAQMQNGFFLGSGLFEIHMFYEGKKYIASFVLHRNDLDGAFVIWERPKNHEAIYSDEMYYQIFGLEDSVKKKFDFFKFSVMSHGYGGKNFKFSNNDFSPQGRLILGLNSHTGVKNFSLDFSFQKTRKFKDFSFVYNQSEIRWITLR